MATEAERKYLVDNDAFSKFLSTEGAGEKLIRKEFIRQAYLDAQDGWEVAVIFDSKGAYLSVSHALNDISPCHFPLPVDEAVQLVVGKLMAGIHKQEEGTCYPISLEHWALRVRVFENGTGELCLKERIAGAERGEVEVGLSKALAPSLYVMSPARISKVRHYIEKSSLMWEVDVFEDANEGLITAELEDAPSEYPLLSFISKELTDDQSYYNESLARHPYSLWP